MKTVADPSTKEYATYWLTRSSENGVLSDRVDIWLARPTRVMVDTYVGWVTAKEGPSAHYGQWTLAMAQHEALGGVPSNDRECLRVGRDA